MLDLVRNPKDRFSHDKAYFIFKIIEAIATAIAGTDGVSLLDVDPGVSTNRTVYTFVGSPDSVIEGALNGARVAYQAIDMRLHQGIVKGPFINFSRHVTNSATF